jgi:hypothetical protein
MLSRETLTWQQLRHPFVLPFLGIDAETFSSSICIVSQWMPERTLRDFIKLGGALIMNIERLVTRFFCDLIGVFILTSLCLS